MIRARSAARRQIEMPVPDVDVAVANSGSFDAQQHLLALGFGIRVLPRLQRLSPFDDLHRTHAGVLHFQAEAKCLRGYFAYHSAFTSRSIHPHRIAQPATFAQSFLVMSIRVARGGGAIDERS